MKKIENIYMLKPIYDGKSGCFYTGTYMPVDELWDLLNDFMYGVDELKRFTLRDKIQFSKDAERLCMHYWISYRRKTVKKVRKAMMKKMKNK